jgi:hypothetical protein
LLFLCCLLSGLLLPVVIFLKVGERVKKLLFVGNTIEELRKLCLERFTDLTRFDLNVPFQIMDKESRIQVWLPANTRSPVDCSMSWRTSVTCFQTALSSCGGLGLLKSDELALALPLSSKTCWVRVKAHLPVLTIMLVFALVGLPARVSSITMAPHLRSQPVHSSCRASLSSGAKFPAISTGLASTLASSMWENIAARRLALDKTISSSTLLTSMLRN